MFESDLGEGGVGRRNGRIGRGGEGERERERRDLGRVERRRRG